MLLAVFRIGRLFRQDLKTRTNDERTFHFIPAGFLLHGVRVAETGKILKSIQT